MQVVAVEKGRGSFNRLTLGFGGSKEYQDYARSLPATADLPATHEHYVEHVEQPKGPPLILVGVRERAGVVKDPAGAAAISDAELETQLGILGVRLPHNTGREKRLAALADAKARAAGERV